MALTAIAVIRSWPRWLMQTTTRNTTMADRGMLSPGHYLIHDRNGKYCPALLRAIDEAGVTCKGVRGKYRKVGRYAIHPN
jgi:hypothetical protein